MIEPWHDECRRLRAEGLSQPEIAAQLKRSPYAIRTVLHETFEQRLALRRVRDRHRAIVRKNIPKPVNVKAEPSGKITEAIKREAILAFSKHEIDRRELMLRITPAAKWSRGGLLRVE
jgi:hypothetical protein